jgi:hypothetical protein
MTLWISIIARPFPPSPSPLPCVSQPVEQVNISKIEFAKGCCLPLVCGYAFDSCWNEVTLLRHDTCMPLYDMYMVQCRVNPWLCVDDISSKNNEKQKKINEKKIRKDIENNSKLYCG